MTDEKHKKLIIFISIFLPLAVAALFGIKIPNVEPLRFLPPIYASINGLTAIVLVVAVIAIKKGNRKTHERLMKVNIILSILFLMMYIAYHMTSDSTPFWWGRCYKACLFCCINFTYFTFYCNNTFGINYLR